jgi:hypothetical protein
MRGYGASYGPYAVANLERGKGFTATRDDLSCETEDVERIATEASLGSHAGNGGRPLCIRDEKSLTFADSAFLYIGRGIKSGSGLRSLFTSIYRHSTLPKTF